MKIPAFLLALLISAAALAQGTPPVQDWTKTQTVTAPATVAVGASGTSTTQIQVTGTGSGMSFKIQGTVDNATWFDLPAYTSSGMAPVAAGTVLTANGHWVTYAGGLQFTRVNFSTISGGAASVYLRSGVGGPGPVPTSALTQIAPNGGGPVATLGVGAGLPAIQRSPFATDDVSLGYKVNDLWIDPSLNLYLNSQATAGQAAWLVQPVALPLDQVGNHATAVSLTAGGSSGYSTANGVAVGNGTTINIVASGGIITGVTLSSPGSWGCSQPSNPVAVPGGTGGTVALTVPTVGIAYSVKLLTACYTTNKAFGLKLVNGSTTTTKDIGFINGTADVGAANSFCAPSPLTCYVYMVYDQSGNVLDATENAVANDPIWYAANTVGGIQAIIFNSVAHGIANQAATQKYLLIPSGFSWQAGASSWFFIGQFETTADNKVIAQSTDASKGFIPSHTWTGAVGFGIEGNGSLCSASGAATVPAEIGPSVMVFDWNGGNLNCFSNNVAVSRTLGTLGGGLTGAHLGSSEASEPSTFDMLAAVAYTRPFSAADRLNAREAFQELFNIPPQTTDIVVFNGDSTSVGAGSVLDNTFGKLALPQLIRPVKAYNVSLFGATLAQNNSGFANIVTGLYSSTYRNFIVHELAFANDIRGGASATTVEAALATFVNNVHALGPNARVVVSTEMIQCDIFGNPTLLGIEQAVNNYIIANWSVPQSSGGLGADGLANYWADPTIGPGNYSGSAFCGSPNAITPDGQHPTDYAMGFFAPIAAGAVNRILAIH